MSVQKLLLFGFCCVSLLAFGQKKQYHKAYFADGTLKEEGWIKKDQKNGYWKFYHSNGNLESEGRFKNNEQTKYWYYYRENGSKIKEGKKVKEWTDLASFKKENKLSDLRQ